MRGTDPAGREDFTLLKDTVTSVEREARRDPYVLEDPPIVRRLFGDTRSAWLWLYLGYA